MLESRRRVTLLADPLEQGLPLSDFFLMGGSEVVLLREIAFQVVKLDRSVVVGRVASGASSRAVRSGRVGFMVSEIFGRDRERARFS